MARYRTRRPQETMHQAVMPLLELRHSSAYYEGGEAMAEQASIVAFDSEVALHALGGARSVPDNDVPLLRGRRTCVHLFPVLSATCPAEHGSS